MSENLIEVINTDMVLEIEETSFNLDVENLITGDYAVAINKPSINSQELTGNKSGSELGLIDLSCIVASLSESVTDNQVLSAKCTKDELVKKVSASGDTVTGNLCFTNTCDSPVVLKNIAVQEYSGICFQNENNVSLGMIKTRNISANSRCIDIIPSDNNGDAAAGLSIGYENGAAYTLAPTPPSASNDTSIATTAWVKSVSIIKSGDTMTGTLTIAKENQDAFIVCRDTDLTRGTIPAADNFQSLIFQDKNAVLVGSLELSHFAAGGNEISLNLYKPVSGSAEYTKISVGYDASGKQYCSFPKCTTKATTTSSAASNLAAVVVENYSNGASWYRVYSDGWCEQGGQCTSFENQYYATVTYLKEFADTNYALLFVQKGINDDTYVSNVDDFSTTTGRFRFRGGCSLIFWEAKGYIN